LPHQQCVDISTHDTYWDSRQHLLQQMVMPGTGQYMVHIYETLLVGCYDRQDCLQAIHATCMLDGWTCACGTLDFFHAQKPSRNRHTYNLARIVSFSVAWTFKIQQEWWQVRAAS